MHAISNPTPFNQKIRLGILWIIAICLATIILISRPMLPEDGIIHEVMETVGLALLVLAVLGRLWSILYIGSKKNQELVILGPYSMTRNPLYFSSLTGLLGVGLVYGSMVLTVVLLMAALIVFQYTALREADFLKARFGEGYADYASRTPLILPRPSLYATSDEVTFSVNALTKTLRDCLPFLVLYPIIEVVEYLHATDKLHPLLVLP